MTVFSKTYHIGDARVTRISELSLPGYQPEDIYPDWNPAMLNDHQNWLSPDSMDPSRRQIFMNIHCWVVKTGNYTILIDPGVGNDKERPYTPIFDHLHLPFPERLSDAGVEIEAVDYVLLTHLHVDHAGWNTRFVDGEWVPSFPNAKYLFSRAEYQYYADPVNQTDRNKTSVIVQRDSITPVIEAGQAEMITIDGSEIIDGFTFNPTPGHSIDHASISLSSGGKEGLFAGDLFHHPIQVLYPGLNSIFDAFPDQAYSSRRWALEYAIDHDVILFSSHFPESSAGRVDQEDNRYDWYYL